MQTRYSRSPTMRRSRRHGFLSAATTWWQNGSSLVLRSSRCAFFSLCGRLRGGRLFGLAEDTKRQSQRQKNKLFPSVKSFLTGEKNMKNVKINSPHFILHVAPVVGAAPAALLLVLLIAGVNAGENKQCWCVTVTVTTDHLADVLANSPRSTHDLSLPLCLSKSRLPRESKPSPRPMPRPLPPRPPRPPPRPRGGLSPEGLRGGHRRCSYITTTTKLQWSSGSTRKPLTESPPITDVHIHSLVHRELPHSLGLVLGRFFESPLAGRSPLRPLVSGSAFALPALMLGPRLALLVWSSAHPPDAWSHQSRKVRKKK